MRPTKLLIFGSPKAGTPLMLAAPSTALDLPLKILVAQTEAGETLLSWNDPAWLQQRHGFPQELAANLAAAQALANPPRIDAPPSRQSLSPQSPPSTPRSASGTAGCGSTPPRLPARRRTHRQSSVPSSPETAGRHRCAPRTPASAATSPYPVRQMSGNARAIRRGTPTACTASRND